MLQHSNVAKILQRCNIARIFQASKILVKSKLKIEIISIF